MSPKHIISTAHHRAAPAQILASTESNPSQHPKMVRSTALLAAVAALALHAEAESMYTKKSPVLQVDTSNYDRLIAKSNYTSIVE